MNALGLAADSRAAIGLLCGPGAEAERIKAFFAAAGDAWPARCPTDPRVLARKRLAALCDEGEWDEAMDFADELQLTGEPWGRELATLTKLRHALQRALRGELEEAERDLCTLERALAQSTG